MGLELEKLFGPDVPAAFDERARRVAEEAYATLAWSRRAPGADEAAREMRAKLARIRAKEFVSVAEAALLLGCSDGHIRNLVRKARKGEARAPVPFRDLDGVVVFKLDELLAWSEQPKGGLKALPARRGADTLAALPAGPRLPERSDVR